ALFHCLLGGIIDLASRRSRYLGLFIFSMIASTLIWSQNVDLITHVRVTAWRVLSAFMLYLAILRPLAARRAGPRPVRRRPVLRRPVAAAARVREAARPPELQWTPRT